MTLKELKNKIAESSNHEWYLNYSIALNYPHHNFNSSLKGVPAIYEFVLKQIEGFQKYTDLPSQFEAIKNRFIQIKDNIVHLLTNNITGDYDWNNSLQQLTNNSPAIFLFDAPETIFLLKTHYETPAYYKGAYELMANGRLSHIPNKDHLIGYMLAAEFLIKDFSQIAERKEAEKKSIASIRADFQNKLGEAETHLTGYLAQANQKFIDYSAKIDELKQQKNAEFSDWVQKTSSDFSQFHQDSNTKIKTLEDLYIEKLKLEAPAQYWNKRAAKLRGEGRNWLIGMVACLVISVLFLMCVLNMVANGTLQKMFSETSTAIKWSVAFITLISFLAYGIRTFAKLTFSSFHLVRDAEEKEQLTYVYLALQKEKGIDSTERHLIMQSLFSRADSGLLKDDSGPTMPGQIIDSVAKK